jgi:hypothetical protein
VEAKFGVGVASFFRLLRFLTSLGALLTLLWGTLLLVPAFYFADPDVGTGIPTGWDLSELSPPLGLSDVLCSRLQSSYLFYAGYPSQFGPYRMDWAFSVFTIAAFLLSALMLFSYFKGNAKPTTTSLVRTDRTYPYASSVFCTWDHSIAGPRAAENLQSAIATELREAVLRERQSMVLKLLSRRQKTVRLLRRFAGLVLTLLLLVVSAFFIYLAQLFSDASIAVTLAVSAVNWLVPRLAKKIVALENYGLHYQRTVHEMSRTLLLKLFNVGIMLLTTQNSLKTSLQTADSCTWGQLGVQLVQLAWIALVGSLFVNLFLPPFLQLWRRVRKPNTPPEPKFFPLSHALVDAIYRQSLLWLGCIVAPVMLPLLTAIHAAIFLLSYHRAMRYCEPEPKPWGANQTHRLLSAFLVVTLALVIAPLRAFFYSAGVSSAPCGPHVYYETETPATAFVDVLEYFDLMDFIQLVTHPAVALTVYVVAFSLIQVFVTDKRRAEINLNTSLADAETLKADAARAHRRAARLRNKLRAMGATSAISPRGPAGLPRRPTTAGPAQATLSAEEVLMRQIQGITVPDVASPASLDTPLQSSPVAIGQPWEAEDLGDIPGSVR